MLGLCSSIPAICKSSSQHVCELTEALEQGVGDPLGLSFPFPLSCFTESRVSSLHLRMQSGSRGTHWMVEGGEAERGAQQQTQ